MYEFLAAQGDGARRRPSPTLRGSIGAAAAILVAGGVLAIAIEEGGEGTNGVGIVLSLLVTGAGYAVLMALRATVRPAGIALVAVGTVAVVGFAFNDAGSTRPALLLLAVAAGAQWAFGPARGAAPLSAISLLSGWALMLDLVFRDVDGADFTATFTPTPTPTGFGYSSGGDEAAYVSLLIGVALLTLTRSLDRQGFHGAATGPVIAGDVAFVTGVWGVVASFTDEGPGSFVILLSGILLAWVGATGERRFTTWLGGVGVLAGLASLVLTVFEPETTTEAGVISAVIGAGVLGAAALLDASPDAAVATTSPEGAPDPLMENGWEKGWHPDPTERHELRWHDGSEWTHHVADGGEASTDEGR